MQICSSHNSYMDWNTQIGDKIERQKDFIPSSGNIFHMVNQYLRVVYTIGALSEKCEECEKMKPEIEALTDTVGSLATASLEEVQEFENATERFFEHLKREHNVKPVRYYSSLFSLIGVGAGSIMGIGIGLFFHEVMTSLLVGWAIGLIGGRLIGSLKDKSVLRKGLQI